MKTLKEILNESVSAHDRVAEQIKKLEEHHAQIAGVINKYKKLHRSGKVDWGHVGDLDWVNTKAAEIAKLNK